MQPIHLRLLTLFLRVDLNELGFLLLELINQIAMGFFLMVLHSDANKPLVPRVQSALAVNLATTTGNNRMSFHEVC